MTLLFDRLPKRHDLASQRHDLDSIRLDLAAVLGGLDGDALSWCRGCERVVPADLLCSACGSPTEVIALHGNEARRAS